MHERGLRLIALRERVQVNGEHRAFDGEGFDCPGLYNRTTRLLQRVGGGFHTMSRLTTTHVLLHGALAERGMG